MTKVVINKGFGVFHLSEKALKLYLDRENSECKTTVDEYTVGNCRHNPNLVAVIEELGNEANGFGTLAEIVEISEDQYFIDDTEWGEEKVITPSTIPEIEWVKVD